MQLDGMKDAVRWNSVKGPMASCIATLLDFGWTITAPNVWEDPQDVVWTLDFGDAQLCHALREVLTDRFSRRIWSKFASRHYAGVDALPDFVAHKALRKKFQGEQLWRHSYFLDAIVQGSMEEYVGIHFMRHEDGTSRCRHCEAIVSESAWSHLSYRCSAMNSLELPGVEASKHLVEQALAELEAMPAKWLRGLLPISLADPLSIDYEYTSSYQIIDVSGKVLGGDGSGGSSSQDFRIRTCGFALIIGDPSLDFSTCSYYGHAWGSVPGKQTVPRAEATALLHALRTTTGYAVFLCDNIGVVKRFGRLAKRENQSKENGLLWQQIAQARHARLVRGHGVLEVVWIPSHLTYENAINMGYKGGQWVINSTADRLAGHAAGYFSSKPGRCDAVKQIQENTELSHLILRRLVDIAVHLAPSESSKAPVCTGEPKITKAQQVQALARGAGHCLSDDFKCIRCNMQINLRCNIAYLDAVLHMKCMGGGVKPHLTLHNKEMTSDGPHHLMFNGVRVHSSHAMATHSGLALHFCTFCGAYGSLRSYNLGLPCPPIPTKAGREVLRLIGLGIQPRIHHDSHLERKRAGLFCASYGRKAAKKSIGNANAYSYGCTPTATQGDREPSPPRLLPMHTKSRPQQSAIEVSPGDEAIIEALNAVPKGICQERDFSARLGHMTGQPDSNSSSSPIAANFVSNSDRSSSCPSIPSSGNPVNPPIRACSQHGVKGSWTIINPCEECIILAMQASLD